MSKGFTLLETVIVIGISAFIMLALVTFYLNFNAVLGTDGALVGVADGARATLGEAELLVLPAHRVLSSHIFSATTSSSNAGALVLEIPSIDSTGAVVAGRYDYALFYKSGTTAYRLLEVDAASSRLAGTKKLSARISSLTFSYNSADFALVTSVEIDVVASSTVKSRTVSTHLREKLYLRNY
jgi:hypothetical protein